MIRPVSKKGIIIILLFAFCSASNAQKKIYDESNYVLVKVDSFNHALDKKTYVYKYDTARKMVINFFYDGIRLGKSFFYHNNLEGPLIVYSYKGEIIAIDTFSKGKKIYSKTFFKASTPPKIFKNGKLQNVKKADIDSLLKK